MPSPHLVVPENLSCTIVHWIKVAWDELDPSIIRRGFKKCCLTNMMDGSEDNLLWEDEADSPEEIDVIDIETEAMYNEEEIYPLTLQVIRHLQ